MFRPGRIFEYLGFTPKVAAPQTVISVTEIAKWLERQPVGKTYDPDDPDTCLFSLFGESLGIEWIAYTEVSNALIERYGNASVELTLVYGVERAGLLALGPYTFGAALDRARALMRLDGFGA